MLLLCSVELASSHFHTKLNPAFEFNNKLLLLVLLFGALAYHQHFSLLLL
ncbi:hypothetical protein FDUTEX481_03904 [Tolypothrix sp. PCC 7601]|nr:hypothetical protein FDUTEX481_03904 [Tolypothrix sp. PCC 7601]